MKRSIRIWAAALAAVTVLAIVLFSPTTGSEGGAHKAHAAAYSHHMHAEDTSHQTQPQPTASMDCQGAAAAGCKMTHCCPYIATAPQEMTATASTDDRAAAVDVSASSTEPGVIVPPPRRVPL